MAIKGDTESQIYLHPHTLMSLATHSTMKLFTLINKVLLFQKTFVQEDVSIKNIYGLFQTLLENLPKNKEKCPKKKLTEGGTNEVVK